jgi:hypothetical protein
MAYTTIDNPELYFQTVLYTGDSSDDNAITFDGDEDMQPDLVWAKGRGNVYNYVADSVRGVTKRLNPDTSIAETTTTDTVASFDSDGFTLDDDATNNWINYNGNNYVAWCWKAGGSASSNSDGTNITSTVSANTDAGFSIASYTGSGTDSDTVGHGLGSAPKMIILKKRDALDSWYVMHTSLSANNALLLDGASAEYGLGTLTYGVLSTSPTSSVFSFAAGAGAVPTGNVNNSSSTYITYCFAEKQGFSKFGTYTGNGSADGTFCFTGMKPAFVMVKKSSSTSGWAIYDNKRSSYNVMDLRLLADTEGAEDQSSDNNLDFLSNGFKFRASAGWNASATYVYMAFAEAPFVNSNGVPCNAR